MAQLTADQLDDLLDDSKIRLLYRPQSRAERDNPDLDPRLAFLDRLNDMLKGIGGNAGTHAYDMMAAVEEVNAGNTRVLIELIAAVAMQKMQEQADPLYSTPDALPKELSITFAPQDIDDMQRAYDMAVKRDGMHVTVTLTRKGEPTESWQLGEGEDGEGAKDQATVAPERPVWAVRRSDGSLVDHIFRDAASAALRAILPVDPDARIENRFCLHELCPTYRCSVWGFDDSNPGNGQNPDGN